MDYVRELPHQEIAVMTFRTTADLETFVVEVCAESDTDYEIIPETTVLLPREVSAHFHRRAYDLGLQFTDVRQIDVSEAREPPSRASWDAFTQELQERFGTPPV